MAVFLFLGINYIFGKIKILKKFKKRLKINKKQ